MLSGLVLRPAFLFINSSLSFRAGRIDFVCVDQRAPSAGIGMLPLYLANCDNLVYHDHQDYQRRGWTRVERTVFAAFNKPSIAVLEPRLGTLEPGPGKRAAAQFGGATAFSGGTLRAGPTKVLAVLEDPNDGNLTAPDVDRPLLARLLAVTKKRWARCWRGSSAQWDLAGLKGLDSLNFGKTEVLVETAEVMEKMVEKTAADPMSSLKAMQANMEAKRFADETRRGYY